jgi:hypothetical protein
MMAGDLIGYSSRLAIGVRSHPDGREVDRPVATESREPSRGEKNPACKLETTNGPPLGLSR